MRFRFLVYTGAFFNILYHMQSESRLTSSEFSSPPVQADRYTQLCSTPRTSISCFTIMINSTILMVQYDRASRSRFYPFFSAPSDVLSMQRDGKFRAARSTRLKWNLVWIRHRPYLHWLLRMATTPETWCKLKILRARPRLSGWQAVPLRRRRLPANSISYRPIYPHWSFSSLELCAKGYNKNHKGLKREVPWKLFPHIHSDGS